MSIKQVTVYKAELPSPEALRQHLAETTQEPIQPHEYYRITTTNTPCGELVSEFVGGYAFSFRIQEKIVPREAFDAAVADAAREYEEQTGEAPDKSEMAQLKIAVHAELCRRAFTKTSYLTGYYWQESRLLFVPTASSGIASRVMAQLVHTCGSVRTATIHISSLKDGLTHRLASWLDHDDEAPALDPFAVGDHVRLERKYHGQAKEVETYDRNGLELAAEQITASVRTGFRVKQIELQQGALTFRLDDKFHMRGISFADEIEDAGDSELTPDQYWRTLTAAKVGLLARAANTLCTMFEYKEPDLSGDDDAQEAA